MPSPSLRERVTTWFHAQEPWEKIATVLGWLLAAALVIWALPYLLWLLFFASAVALGIGIALWLYRTWRER